MISSISKKLWQILPSNQRRGMWLLLCLTLVGMLLEILGIGLVIPTLVLLSQGDFYERFPIAAQWIISSRALTTQELVVASMLALVGVYIFKATFLAFVAWRQSLFIFGMQADISHKLFAGYLSQPYTFHLQRNSAQLIRNATGEVNEFTVAVQASIAIVTESLVIFGITVLLLTVEPVGALLVTTSLGIAAWWFYRITRIHILRWGEARQFHDGKRYQHLQQGLGGAKDVKLLGREDEFLAQYNLHNLGSSQVSQRQNTLQQLPRLWLELLAVIGLSGLVFVMIGQGKPMASLLPTLGLFAAAAFRLLPSANRILNAIQGMRYALPVINNLHSELQLFTRSIPRHEHAQLPYRKSLKLVNVSFTYPTSQKPVLHEINLNIRAGTSVGFIGGSGTGKSTIVDIIMGLLPPDGGAVLVDNQDIGKNLRGWQDQIGYVPQSIFLTDDTLLRNVAFGLPNEQINESAVWQAIQAAQLAQFVNELPQGLNTMVGERGIRLSGGQRQRIGIARALYHDPDVLILDEATSSLDAATESGVMEAVRILHGRKTIIIVAHRLTTVAHCDWLYRLENGTVVAEGTPAQLLRQAGWNIDSSVKLA